MPQVTGLVGSINIKGQGQNSAQMLFVVNGKPLVVTAYPAYEPQVFSSMASLVIAAFYAGGKVTVQYKNVTGQTSRDTEIEVS